MRTCGGCKLEVRAYPEKLQRDLRNSSVVVSAWDGQRLVGLARGLGDGETVGFIHDLLVDPEYQGQHIAAALMERLMERYQDFLHETRAIRPGHRAVL